MDWSLSPARIMPVTNERHARNGLTVAVLRLDEVHPVISGNKWFKLQAYFAYARRQQKKAILTWGGAFSNHILATAAACSLQGFAAIGIIRGEAPKHFSPTLTDAAGYGMHLIFTSRDFYKRKLPPPEVYGLFKKEEIYSIAEGGYGIPGMEGSMDILKSCDTTGYTHIIAAAGTGTMLSGLVMAAAPVQQVIGISVLKNNFSLQSEVEQLLAPTVKPVTLIHDFHFGGYAKQSPALLKFMNRWFDETGIPTDFVYTAKTFYAAEQLIQTNFFKQGSSLLLIQSGGLQGNRSLPEDALRF